MILLTDVLEKRCVIYRLMHDWGFVTVPHRGPQIYPDTNKPPEKARLCFVVESDPDLIKINSNFKKNEKLRRSYLQDELSMQLNCEVNIDSSRIFKKRFKNGRIKKMIDFTKADQVIVSHFGQYQFFKECDFTSKIDVAFNADSWSAMRAFKNQIAAIKYTKAFSIGLNPGLNKNLPYYKAEKNNLIYLAV